MEAETLIQVEAAKVCFWLANLLSEMLYCKSNDDQKIKIECYMITINYMILFTLSDL